MAKRLLRGGSRACKRRLRVRAWSHASFIFSSVFMFPKSLKLFGILSAPCGCSLEGFHDHAFMHARAYACTLFYYTLYVTWLVAVPKYKYLTRPCKGPAPPLPPAPPFSLTQEDLGAFFVEKSACGNVPTS